MNRAELEEVFNRVYVGQYKKNEKKKVFDGSKTLDRNYFSRIRRVRLRNYLSFLLYLQFCLQNLSRQNYIRINGQHFANHVITCNVDKIFHISSISSIELL